MTSTSQTAISSKNKPIVFFGTEDFSLVTLSALIESGWPIAAVVTKPDTPKGRGQHLTPPRTKVLALQHDIPVWQPQKLGEIADNIRQLNEPVGVLVSYGKIVPQSIIDIFTPGIINLHPSLLPKYRGPSPIEAAILNGDATTGVSIMQLAKEMDAGPVYRQVTVPLDGTETRTDLYGTLALIGTKTLIDALPSIIDNTLLPQSQDETRATYCQLLQKADALLDPNTCSAAEAERKVRAHLGFPKTKIELFGHPIIITKAHTSTHQKTPLDIRCQDGAFLSIDELIGPSGKTMSANAFLNGYAAA